ncbi:hypothetical protein AB0A71_21640 [Kitasatospora aureofaciens]|uniref:hypothetical protein n=1 Tax=Kitasatospora aureofaciens TaxID=1894 RepID=UPI0033EBA33A
MSAARSAPAPAPTVAPVRTAALDLRVLRALPFATVCVALAAAGHALASGSAVPPGALLLGWVLLGTVAALAARRERSLRAIVGGLAMGQGGLHVLFHAARCSRRPPVTAGPAHPSAVFSMAGMPEMPGMHDMPGMAGISGALAGGSRRPGPSAAHVAAGSGATAHVVVAATHVSFWSHTAVLGLSPGMLVAHLAATVAAGWWLWRGEVAVWRLVQLTAATVSATVHARAASLRLRCPRPRRRGGRQGRPGAGEHDEHCHREGERQRLHRPRPGHRGHRGRRPRRGGRLRTRPSRPWPWHRRGRLGVSTPRA